MTLSNGTKYFSAPELILTKFSRLVDRSYEDFYKIDLESTKKDVKYGV